MKNLFGLSLFVIAHLGASRLEANSPGGPIRVLFLGHESEHHDSSQYFPMLQQALGRDAIYFDYVTQVEDAFGDAAFLNRFDACLLYTSPSPRDRSLSRMPSSA